MMKSSILLFRAMLLSTSQRNIYRYTRDIKKKKQIRLGVFGATLLYAMLMGYSISLCVGYGNFGLIDAAPVMCALVISGLAFFFTFFRTNGYLFHFKEYDMLMSLPFAESAVAGCKFLYMYVKSLPWYESIALAMMIGYGYYKRPAIRVYLLWILLSFFLPLIPMLFSAFLGFLVARIGTGFRQGHLIRTVLTFGIVIFCFSLQYIINAFFSDGKIEESLGNIALWTQGAGEKYPPAGWFSDAITKGSLSGSLLLIGCSILLFALVFAIVGRSYRNINSALQSHARAKNFRMQTQRKQSVVVSIAKKEWRRLAASTTYMVNGAMGEVLATLLGIVTLVLGFDRVLGIITKGAPLTAAMVAPAIPFIVHFCIGMMSTTACSLSLEGKNYWILASLPIEKITVYQGKILFQLCLSVPFSV